MISVFKIEKELVEVRRKFNNVFTDPTEFTKTPESAPTSDYEVANKKYVDDSVISSQYTPILTGIANVATSSAGPAYYVKTGSFVTVYGSVSVQGSVASTVTTIDLSLPIASNLSAGADLTGTGGAANANASSTLTANTTNDRARLTYFGGSGTPTYLIQYNFRYKII